MVSFLWPWALTLLPIPLIIRKGSPESCQQSAPELPPGLKHSLAKTHNRPPIIKLKQQPLLWLLWISLVIALAQPQAHLGSEIPQATGRSLMLAIDLSGSMEREDFELNGKQDNRLQVVKAFASEFINKRNGDRLGLVLFGDEAFVASPLSFDLSTIIANLNDSAIGMAGRTTALGDALGLSLINLRDDPARDKTIILLSDGSNNAGSADPKRAAEIAAQWGIKIYSIGLGSTSAPGSNLTQNPSAELDTATLKAVASISNGKYFRATNSEELIQIYEAIDALESSASEAPPVIPRTDLRHYFLLSALLALMGLVLRRQRASRFSS